ncbi:MAG: putative bifunctional diguanylate cyclase/phosphodiesterase [Nitrospirota bacterium]
MISPKPYIDVARYVCGLAALFVTVALTVIVVLQLQYKQRERLRMINSDLHLEVIQRVDRVRSSLRDMSEGLRTPDMSADAAADLLDRAVPVVTEHLRDIDARRYRFEFKEADHAWSRVRLAMDRVMALIPLAGDPSGLDIAQLNRGVSTLEIRFVQFARFHELASDDIKTRLLTLESRQRLILLIVVLSSLVPTGLITMRIVHNLHRMLLRQAAVDEALRKSESRLRQTLDNMFAFVGMIAPDGVVTDVNSTAIVATGQRREDVVGCLVWETAFFRDLPDAADVVRSAVARAASGETVRQDISVRIASDVVLLMDSIFSPMFDEQRNVSSVIGFGVDVTARNRAQEYMRMLSTALEQTADSVMITATNGIIEYVNQAFVRTTGYDPYEVIGLTPKVLKSGKHTPEFYRVLWETILGGNSHTEVFVNRRKDGSLYSEEKTITPLKDASGRITHFVSAGRDISERLEIQEQLHFLANHDALTGLPNRTLFFDRLEQAISRARWTQRVVATMFVDLDQFKNVNDTLGHHVGDELLRVIAGRLTATVRNGDTVARFGGDEFVVLLDNVANASDVALVAQKFLDALVPPVELGATLLQVGASIGVSTFPADGQDPNSLLKYADIAMYRAKESGRNAYQFYSREMSARALERIMIESQLRQALTRGEFALHYQPQIDVLRNHIVGVEALLRWHQPDRGLVSPAQFVPVLEETGLIVPVGEWVLAKACEQLAQWRAAGLPYLRMAVNLSSRQFEQAKLAAVVAEALSRVALPPDALEVEMTESLLMRPTEVTQRTITALDELGVRFGLDDFGTGFSSLSYLQRYPFDTLKLDRSFVRDLPNDAHDAALTRAILAMGQSLKLDVVAEGVETDAQREFLLTHGCVTMQGFLFARPMPAEDFSAWISERVRKSGDAEAA